MTDWLMVIITAVYVVATIFICVFNAKSANAAREQLEESKRQFDLSNKPIIVTEIIHTRRTFCGLRFSNVGTQPAWDFQIFLDDEFIDALPISEFQSIIKKNNGKKQTLGVGQHYEVYYGNEKYMSSYKARITGKIIYSDKFGNKHEDRIDIDPNEYAILFSVQTDMDDLKKKIDELKNELKGIKNNIAGVSRSIQSASEETENNDV